MFLSPAGPIKDINLLESIQRRALKRVKGVEGKLYKDWLSSLGLWLILSLLPLKTEKKDKSQCQGLLVGRKDQV